MLFFVILGCKPIKDVEVTLTDVATVPRVTWTTRRDEPSYVEYGPKGGPMLQTPAAAGTEHEVLLLGLPAEGDIEMAVVAGDDRSEGHSVTTKALPFGVPVYEAEGEPFGSYVVAPFYDPGQSAGPAVLDAQGNTVWYHQDTRGMYVPRARVRHDGQGMVYNVSDLNGNEEGTALVWVDWDGTVTRTEEVEKLSHDFIEKEDGTVVALAFEIRDGVKGNRLVEITPDGTQTDIWSAWNCFDPAVQTHPDMAFGWTFTNALDYHPDTDTYYVGLRNFGSIAAIDGATGECEWVFGGLGATITPDLTTTHQHQFEVMGDKLLVFDNDGGGDGLSRVIEYGIDGQTATAEWCHQNGLYNLVLGDVHRDPNGDTTTTWAVDGRIERVDAGGEFMGAVDNGVGIVVGFTSFPDDLYAPSPWAPVEPTEHPAGSGECAAPLPEGTGTVDRSGTGTVVTDNYAGTESLTLHGSEDELLCEVTYSLTSVAPRLDCADKAYDCFWGFDLTVGDVAVNPEADLFCDALVADTLGVADVDALDGLTISYAFTFYLGHAHVLRTWDGKAWDSITVLPADAWDSKTGAWSYTYAVGTFEYGQE